MGKEVFLYAFIGFFIGGFAGEWLSDMIGANHMTRDALTLAGALGLPALVLLIGLSGRPRAT